MRNARSIGLGITLFIGAVLTLCTATAQADTTIEIRDLSFSELKVAYVTVDRDMTVEIEAVGGEYKSGAGMFAYAWIIDAKSRDPVWSMDEEITEEVPDSPLLRSYKDDLRLRPGSYELYYFAGSPSKIFNDLEFGNLSDFLTNLGEAIERLKLYYDEDSKEINLSSRKLAQEYHVSLTGNSEFLHETDGSPGRTPVVTILKPENDSYRSVPFALTEQTQLDVYAIGEYWVGKGAMVDWGWIADERSGEHVWEMSSDNTEYAGGADKNRRFRGRVTLPRGGYAAYYVTDDSHTYDGWNSPPPYDPEAWGLQIFATLPGDASKIKPVSETAHGVTVVRLAGVGDNELLSQAFRLDKTGPLRIYAIGEYDRYRDRMADYAWVETKDGGKVWVMTGSNTVPAGGAAKNRQFDGVVRLDAGEYVVSYLSDGSHSYADGWNTTPPLDQKAYGVTIYTVDETLEKKDFELVDRAKSKEPGLLVTVICTGANAKCEGRFELASLTRVRVRGMGEGRYPTMNDYGWIVNLSSGDVVWEMTYRKTSPAGGADKNREVDQVILLDKGEYAVYYVTDGSHSPDSWNDDPPDPPVHWGLALSKADQEGF